MECDFADAGRCKASAVTIQRLVGLFFKEYVISALSVNHRASGGAIEFGAVQCMLPLVAHAVPMLINKICRYSGPRPRRPGAFKGQVWEDRSGVVRMKSAPRCSYSY